MRTLIAAILLLSSLAGCSTPPEAYRTYVVTVMKPDGTPYRKYNIDSTDRPRVTACDDEGGCLRVVYDDGLCCRRYTQPFPVGWFVEVTPAAEVIQ